jgi:two-component system, sensor histidine kinase
LTGSLLSFSSAALIAVLLVCGVQAWLLLRLRRAMRDLAREAEVRKRREQEARAANLAKDQFLANASHEIRTPMNGVLGMTDLLLRGELTAAQREQVKLIRTSAEALLALVSDILDLSRIEAGHLLLRPRDFRLREVVGEVMRLLASQAAEREIELRLQVAADLPDELHGDPVRLRQVLINLVGNGIRHTTEGFVAVDVAAREGAEGAPQIRFEVRDTGIGIRPEVQARLFRPFSRSESSASRVPGGAGLGLVISKNVVELMAGEIGLDSTYGAGSTFWFQVPLVPAQGTVPDLADVVDAADTADTAASSRPAPDRRRDARRHVHVLVVDDHPVNRALALAQLQDLGYVADTAENGQEALDLLVGRSYDAVVLDCAMPEIDGYETCRRLRQREGDGRRTPVIALTAFANEGERERCLAAGMDDYLAKPYRGEELAALVDRWTAERAREAARIAERLSSLQRLGEAQGEELRARIAEAFREHGAQDLETMRTALARGDGEAVAAAGHSLGGSAGVLGATTLATCCAELETLARQGDLAACAPRLQRVEREYRAFEERLSP